MVELDPASRHLGILLGLGDLNHAVCHSYPNGCVCEDCLARAENVRRPKPVAAFPWEEAA